MLHFYYMKKYVLIAGIKWKNWNKMEQIGSEEQKYALDVFA